MGMGCCPGWWQITWRETLLNAMRPVLLGQIERNIKRDIPWFTGRPPHKRTALIAGGGPSLESLLPKLRFHRKHGDLFCINNTHDYLIERGIVPDYHVLLDGLPIIADFVKNPHSKVTYLVNAQCHPSVFDALEGYKVILWVSGMDGVREMVEDLDKPVCLVGGGSTCALKTMYLAYLMGYRRQRYYGIDSSYTDKRHAYDQDEDVKEIKAYANGREFVTKKTLANQAAEFVWQAGEMAQAGCGIKVYGEGLLPHLYNGKQEVA